MSEERTKLIPSVGSAPVGKSKPYCEGWRAQKRGKFVNPYIEDHDDAYDEWEKGWEESSDDDILFMQNNQLTNAEGNGE